MKQTLRHTFWVGLLAVALAVPAFAEDGAGGAKPEAAGENRFEAAANRLNLSAEQREKLKALRQSQKQQMMELRQALQDARMKFKETLDNPGASPDTVAPLAENVKTILAKMVDHRIEGVFAAKSILTPDQFSQLQQFQQQNPEMKRECRPFWKDIKLKRSKGKGKMTEGNEGEGQ